jgi:hypothetical protein
MTYNNTYNKNIGNLTKITLLFGSISLFSIGFYYLYKKYLSKKANNRKYINKKYN